MGRLPLGHTVGFAWSGLDSLRLRIRIEDPYTIETKTSRVSNFSTTQGVYDLRITIVTVDINRALAGPWGIVSIRRSIIAYQRNDNSGIVSLIDHVLEVVWVREIYTAASSSILVFRLVEYHRAAICYLSVGNGARNIGDVAASMRISSSNT